MARVTLWQPLNEMLAMNAAMDQMARNRARARSTQATTSMPVDVAESAERYTVSALLPGVHPDNLEIDFSDDTLTIRAHSKAAEEQEGVYYHLRERVAANYERSFRFPLTINADAIEASYENGLLTLSLPKAESVKPRRITVQASA